LAVLVIGFGLISAVRSASISPSHVHLGWLAERTAWLGEAARAGEHLASEYPTVDYLYSGLATLEYPYPATEDNLLAFLVSSDVEYLLVAPVIRWMTPYYIPELSQDMTQIATFLDKLENAGRLQLVYSNPNNLVRGYRVMR
jgi:hypothetical protein